MIFLEQDRVVFDRQGLTTQAYSFPCLIAHCCPQCGGLIHAVIEYPENREVHGEHQLEEGSSVPKLELFAAPSRDLVVGPDFRCELFTDPVSGTRLLQIMDLVHFVDSKNAKYGRCLYNHAVIGGDEPAAETVLRIVDKIRMYVTDMSLKPCATMLTPMLEPVLKQVKEHPDLAEHVLDKLKERVHTSVDERGGSFPLYLISTGRFDQFFYAHLVADCEQRFRQYFPAEVAPAEVLEDEPLEGSEVFAEEQ